MSEPVIQYAYINFIYIGIAALFLALGIVTYKVTILDGNSIAVLGMKGSGKTTFLHNLSGGAIPLGEGTSLENYKEFKIVIDNKKEIKIKSGEDIPGSDSFFGMYEKLIKEKDITFFFFNAYEFLNNNEYKKKTKQRLYLIFTVISQKYNEGGKGLDELKKRYAIIGTHSDKFDNPKKSLKNISDNLLGDDILKDIKHCKELIYNNFFLVDTRNNQYEFLNKLFNK